MSESTSHAKPWEVNTYTLFTLDICFLGVPVAEMHTGDESAVIQAKDIVNKLNIHQSLVDAVQAFSNFLNGLNQESVDHQCGYSRQRFHFAIAKADAALLELVGQAMELGAAIED